MFRRRTSLSVIIIIFTLSIFSSIKVEASTITKRLAGTNRYGTSAAVSLAGWQKSDYAVLASGEDFPDAISATPLAKKYNAPILLTTKDSLPAETINAMQQLKVKNIFIIGGTGAVSLSVENKLNLMGIKTTRLAGQDRYETCIKIAEQLDNIGEIAIVTGEDFSDAVSIAPIAGAMNMPIILIQHNIIPDVVKNYISAHNVNKTYVVGAGDTIDNAVLTGLINVDKISGQDKYQRNLAIIDKFKSQLKFDTIYVVSGDDFPDALSGSALASINSNPMLLIGSDIASEKDYFNNISININNVKILGGTGVVTGQIINKLISAPNSSEVTTSLLTVQDVAQNANAVVLVEAKDSNNQVFATGSGCIISSDGKLITNYHVIDGACYADVILQDGTKYEISGILGYSKEKDIAILQIKNASKLPIVQIGNSETVKLADPIVAIGSPLGFENTVSTGIVSGLNRDSITGRTGTDIQISAAITNGSSGGALLNMNGQVIGITYAGEDTGDINFAIPINDVKPLINISTLTTLAEVNGITATIPGVGNTPNSTGFLPKLSDVPIVPNINYDKTAISDDGKIVYYYYDVLSLPSNFLSIYDSLLKSNGWKLYESYSDSLGNPQSFYIKDTEIILIGYTGDYVAIMGYIH
jgi:serine protease Do